MKKYIFLFVLLVLTSFTLANAQVMRVHLMNGSVVEYNSEDVNYVDFVTSPGGGTTGGDIDLSLLQGVWMLVFEEGYEYGYGSYADDSTDDKTQNYYYFNGKNFYNFYQDKEYGDVWKMREQGTFSYDATTRRIQFVGRFTDSDEILSLTATELKLTDSWGDKGEYFIETYQRVSDDVLQKIADKIR